MDESHMVSKPDDTKNTQTTDGKPRYVLVIGATNRPDVVDPILRRPGRFDREIALGVLDENARIKIFIVLIQNLKLEGAFDLMKISRSTPGFIGADLAALVNKAGNLAMKRIIDGRKSELSKENSETEENADCFFIISSITVQTSDSGISSLLAVGTTFTGSGNLYCQWELSTGSGNAFNKIMARLQFYDYHNMVDILEKSEHNVDFHSIMDFVEASPLRRNLKLKDEEGISSLPNAKLFENLTLMGYNISPNQKFTFQKDQFFRQWKYLIHTIMQCMSPKSTGFNEFSSNIVTALICLATNRVYNFSKMIFDDEPVSPLRDVSQGEACPTDYGFGADQDKANIA
nr:cell division control protein 48 homolog C [Tanacetum cinerariifolium]